MDGFICPVCGNTMSDMNTEHAVGQYFCKACGSILVQGDVLSNIEEQELHLTTREEFEKYYIEVIAKRQKFEAKVAQECKDSIQVDGFCEVCNQETKFLLDFLYSDGRTPNFRERMVCPICNLNNRQRYIVDRIKKHYSAGKKIYMYEQITSVYNEVKKIADDLIGSEFISPELKSGTIVDGILHEDAEKLSLEDNSFDLVVSNDVFEHVNDINKCLQEAFRILKRGGAIMLSIPFYTDKDKTKRRAKLEGGKVINFEEPIYHGNPMSKEGSLVFFDFGWDFIQMLRDAGFKKAYMIPYYSEEKGYLGGIPFILEAIK